MRNQTEYVKQLLSDRTTGRAELRCLKRRETNKVSSTITPKFLPGGNSQATQAREPDSLAKWRK